MHVPAVAENRQANSVPQLFDPWIVHVVAKLLFPASMGEDIDVDGHMESAFYFICTRLASTCPLIHAVISELIGIIQEAQEAPSTLYCGCTHCPECPVPGVYRRAKHLRPYLHNNPGN